MSPEHLAEQMFATNWDGAVPVDVYAIAAMEGVSIVRSSSLPKGVVARFTRFFDRTARIEVCATEPLIRQRFAIAHALGHHALGHLSCDGVIGSFSAQATRAEDREATRFALALLMPQKLLAKAIRQCRLASLSPATLASTFSVAEVALAARLEACLPELSAIR